MTTAEINTRIKLLRDDATWYSTEPLCNGGIYETEKGLMRLKILYSKPSNLRVSPDGSVIEKEKMISAGLFEWNPHPPSGKGKMNRNIALRSWLQLVLERDDVELEHEIVIKTPTQCATFSQMVTIINNTMYLKWESPHVHGKFVEYQVDLTDPMKDAICIWDTGTSQPSQLLEKKVPYKSSL